MTYHTTAGKVSHRAARLFSRLTSLLGSFGAIGIAVAVIVGWAVSGPLFEFSDAWQLVISTFTSAATFVMVFILQNTQNRDSRALQAKLDAIAHALDDATAGRLVGLEQLPERVIAREHEDLVRDAGRTAG
jgi:low affinity Fe/Cu permease